MITSWMLYAFLVAALVTLAAAILDRTATAARRPKRFIWASALGASLLLPVVLTALRAIVAFARPVILMPFTITVQSPTVVASASNSVFTWDRALLALWLTVSVALLARLVRDMNLLRRRRRTWRDGEVDGTSVRLSTDVGPAVVGLRPMDVVVPDWILSLDAPLRAIVLRHEEEHRRARDPYLLFAAEMAHVIMPWNLPLWFQTRRLRLAIEMDCDARVLRVHPSTERYGLLMLTIAQRGSVAPLLATMLSEPATNLERRILAMRSTTRRIARFTMIAGGLVAATALAFACSLQSDDPTAPKPSVSHTGRSAPSQYGEFQITHNAEPAPGTSAPRYPNLLRSSGVEGDVVAQFIVDADGSIDMSTFKVLKTSHDLFTASVRNALAQMRMIPAQVDGRPVKQLLQMPFTFRLSGDSVGPAHPPVVGTLKAPVGTPNAPPVGYVAPRAPGVAPGSHVVTVPPYVRGAPTPVGVNDTYRDYQVEQEASPYANNSAPRYPDALRQANIQGSVLAQFVVDVQGHADMGTFIVLKSSHELFTNAVASSLPNMRFYPAKVGGMPVKQLVTMPFNFSLTK